MTTDVTAQAFREAAEAERWKAHGIGLTYVVELLLAAAEQREQLDATNAQLDTYMAENEALHALIKQVHDLVAAQRGCRSFGCVDAHGRAERKGPSHE